MYTFTRFSPTMSRNDELTALNDNFAQVENDSAKTTPGNFKDFDPAYSGWSSLFVEDARYARIGNTAIVYMAVSGPSNSATTTATLPFKSKNRMTVMTYNADTASYLGVAQVEPDSNLLNFYRGSSSNPQQAWGATGFKTIYGFYLQYEIA